MYETGGWYWIGRELIRSSRSERNELAEEEFSFFV